LERGLEKATNSHEKQSVRFDNFDELGGLAVRVLVSAFTIASLANRITREPKDRTQAEEEQDDDEGDVVGGHGEDNIHARDDDGRNAKGNETLQNMKGEMQRHHYHHNAIYKRANEAPNLGA